MKPIINLLEVIEAKEVKAKEVAEVEIMDREWLNYEYLAEYECSECNEPTLYLFNYCPFCGATFRE